MLRPKNRVILWIGLTALVLFAGCANPMPAPTPEPTPIAALIPPSGRPITAADAAAMTCLAHWVVEPLYRLAWSPDQGIIGVASFAGAYLYDSRRLRQPRFIQDPVMIGMPSIDFSPDGKLMAAGSQEDNRVWVYRDGSGEIGHELRGRTGEVEAVAFSPDGTIDLWGIAR